jgi:RNA polymerase sigma factor (sigma-70 family)
MSNLLTYDQIQPHLRRMTYHMAYNGVLTPHQRNEVIDDVYMSLIRAHTATTINLNDSWENISTFAYVCVRHALIDLQLLKERKGEFQRINESNFNEAEALIYLNATQSESRTKEDDEYLKGLLEQMRVLLKPGHQIVFDYLVSGETKADIARLMGTSHQNIEAKVKIIAKKLKQKKHLLIFS